MPWRLTTPISAGDLDTTSYAEIKIVRQIHDSVRKMFMVELEYGNTVDTNWISGVQPRNKQLSIIIQGEDYVNLIDDAMPEPDEKTYDAVKRGLYNYLHTNSIIGDGTLE